MAAQVAREKGEQLASLMGAKLGKVVSVTDGSARTSYTPWWYGNGSANISAQATRDVAPADATPDSIVSGGQIAVEASEEVVFALE